MLRRARGFAAAGAAAARPAGAAAASALTADVAYGAGDVLRRRNGATLWLTARRRGLAARRTRGVRPPRGFWDLLGAAYRGHLPAAARNSRRRRVAERPPASGGVRRRRRRACTHSWRPDALPPRPRPAAWSGILGVCSGGLASAPAALLAPGGRGAQSPLATAAHAVVLRAVRRGRQQHGGPSTAGDASSRWRSFGSARLALRPLLLDDAQFARFVRARARRGADLRDVGNAAGGHARVRHDVVAAIFVPVVIACARPPIVSATAPRLTAAVLPARVRCGRARGLRWRQRPAVHRAVSFGGGSVARCVRAVRANARRAWLHVQVDRGWPPCSATAAVPRRALLGAAEAARRVVRAGRRRPFTPRPLTRGTHRRRPDGGGRAAAGGGARTTRPELRVSFTTRSSSRRRRRPRQQLWRRELDRAAELAQELRRRDVGGRNATPPPRPLPAARFGAARLQGGRRRRLSPRATPTPDSARGGVAPRAAAAPARGRSPVSTAVGRRTGRPDAGGSSSMPPRRRASVASLRPRRAAAELPTRRSARVGSRRRSARRRRAGGPGVPRAQRAHRRSLHVRVVAGAASTVGRAVTRGRCRTLPRGCLETPVSSQHARAPFDSTVAHAAASSPTSRRADVFGVAVRQPRGGAPPRVVASRRLARLDLGASSPPHSGAARSRSRGA